MLWKKSLACGMIAAMGISMLAPMQQAAYAEAEVQALDVAALANPAKLIQLDPSYQQAPFEGWGTALVWFANITGGWPDAKKNKLADDLYSEQGLNFNIARYNIGGEDAPETEPYMRKGGAVPGYWNRPAEVTPGTENWWDPGNPSHWDWDKDSNQQWWLLAAKERGADRLEAFSNSAPYFMTKSGFVSGNIKADQNNLKDDQYDNFATYLAEVVRYFNEELEVKFNTLSPVNEPNTNYWGKGGRQEGSHWDPSAQAKMLMAAQQALKARNLSTVVSGMDESVLDTFVTNWDNYGADARAAISQLNTHTYGGSKRTAVRDIAKGANKPLWMSEVDLGGGVDQNFEDIRPGLALAKQITTDIRQLEPRAWVLWQAIEDGVNMNAAHENSNWGLIHVDFAPEDPATVEINYNKKYYTMGNYSKFIRPGYRIINSDNSDTLAAIDPNSDTAVVVYRNESTSELELDIDLSGFGQVAENASATPTVTSASDHLSEKASIAVENQRLVAAVQPQSITTFVIKGVTGVNPKRVLGGTSDAHEYKIVNKDSSKVLDLKNNADLAAASLSIVQQENSTSKSTQEWKIERLSAGYDATGLYRVVHKATGKALGIVNGGAVISEWSDQNSQKWVISTDGLGEYSLVNRETGLLLEVGGFSKENGAGVGNYQANGGANQVWKLVREAILEQVTAVEVMTATAHAPSLPEQVIGVYDDGSRRQLSVAWSAVPSEQYAAEGTFTVEGAITGTELKAVAHVTVSGIKQVDPAWVKTMVKQAPVLPKRVDVVFNNDKRGTVDVVWQEIEDSLYAERGKFPVEGTIAGTELAAAAYVQVADRTVGNIAKAVLNQTYPKPIASFTNQYDSLADLNDDVISQSASDNPKNRWSNWISGGVRPADWMGIDFGQEKTVNGVKLFYYSDQGCSQPQSMVLERWDAANEQWVEIPGTSLSGNEVKLTTELSFNEISTSQLRVNMKSTATLCIAATEMQVNGFTPLAGADSTADMLYVNGTKVAGFAADVLQYTVTLPRQTEELRVVASTSDLFATAQVELPAELPGEARIKVTSEDGAHTTTYRIQIAKDNSVDPGPGSYPSGPYFPTASSTTGASDPAGTKTVKLSDLMITPSSNAVTLPSDIQRVELTPQMMKQLQQKPLEVKVGEASLIVPAEVLQDLSKLAGATPASNGKFVIGVAPAASSSTTSPIYRGESSSRLKPAGGSMNLELLWLDASKTEVKLEQLAKPIALSLPVTASTNARGAALYVYDAADKTWSLVQQASTGADHHATVTVGAPGQYGWFVYEKSFADVPATHWAKGTIQTLVSLHMLTGVSEDSFQPERQMTRAEFSKLIAETLGLKATEGGKSPFADVAADAWYANAVSAMHAAGLIQGVDEETYAPNRPISRAELAVLLVRAYAYAAQTDAAADSSVLATFADADDIPAWAVQEVGTAVSMGLMKGQSGQRFAPLQQTTRAEAAQAVLNLLDKLAKQSK